MSLNTTNRTYGDVAPAGDIESELPLFSSRADLAQLFRVNERTIDRWRIDGLLRVTKIGRGKQGRCLFLREHVAQFIRGGER